MTTTHASDPTGAFQDRHGGPRRQRLGELLLGGLRDLLSLPPGTASRPGTMAYQAQEAVRRFGVDRAWAALVPRLGGPVDEDDVFGRPGVMHYARDEAEGPAEGQASPAPSEYLPPFPEPIQAGQVARWLGYHPEADLYQPDPTQHLDVADALMRFPHHPGGSDHHALGRVLALVPQEEFWEHAQRASHLLARASREARENGRMAHACLLEAAGNLPDGPEHFLEDLEDRLRQLARVLDLSHLPRNLQLEAARYLRGLPRVREVPGGLWPEQLAVFLPSGFDVNKFLDPTMAGVKVYRVGEHPRPPGTPPPGPQLWPA
jgi:hypothetical protein